MRPLINFVAFQVGWFAAVLGAAHGRTWLGLIVVPLVLLLDMALAKDWKQELTLAFAAAGMGFVFDTLLTAAGVFKPVECLWPAPFSPPWMIMLWVNQAMTLNGCMSWLRGRYALGTLFGAIGGPAAYLAGARLGAAAVPSSSALLILAFAWAAAFPALLWVAGHVKTRPITES